MHVMLLLITKPKGGFPMEIKTKIRYLIICVHGSIGNFNFHRCEMASNDEFLIRNDNTSPELPITPLVLVRNVR